MRKSELWKAVLQTCEPVLKAAGFVRRTEGIYTLPISTDFLGCLGFNSSMHWSDDMIGINPIVGIRSQALEKLVAEITGAKFHRYLPASASTSLGYVQPEREFRMWEFALDAPYPDPSSMLDAILGDGARFMKQHASDEGLLALLLARMNPQPERRAERIPLLQLALGRPEEALEYVRNHRAQLAERGPEALAEYEPIAMYVETQAQALPSG